LLELQLAKANTKAAVLAVKTEIRSFM